jgi:hypothetical protein
MKMAANMHKKMTAKNTLIYGYTPEEYEASKVKMDTK